MPDKTPSTRIAIIGAGGRMGAALVRCGKETDGVDVVAALERDGHPALGNDAGTHSGTAGLGIAITADTAPLEHADVFIDFSFHTAVPDHAALAAELGKGFVLGATGLTDGETRAVLDAAGHIPLVWSPNMSLGMNVLLALVQNAAAALDPSYDIEIVETHHRHKQDAPSGTALALAEFAAAGRRVELDDVGCYGRKGHTGERPEGQIGIHAVRAGGVVGDHIVTLASEFERIELTHRAGSRDAFATGAITAAQWVNGRPPAHYTMRDVLGLA